MISFPKLRQHSSLSLLTCLCAVLSVLNCSGWLTTSTPSSSSSSSQLTSSMMFLFDTIFLVLRASCIGWFFSSRHLMSCYFLYSCIMLSIQLSGVIVGFISSSRSISFLVMASLACLGHFEDCIAEQVEHSEVSWVFLAWLWLRKWLSTKDEMSIYELSIFLYNFYPKINKATLHKCQHLSTEFLRKISFPNSNQNQIKPLYIKNTKKVTKMTDSSPHNSLHQTQQIYKTKLSQITSTRHQISQQLQQLHHTYDKKIKQLEHKVQSFQQQNDILVKENMLFRNQIGYFQSRLLEKEKIIALLLAQRKQVGGFSGSDRSKSQLDASGKGSQRVSQDGGRKEKKEVGRKDQGALNSWGKKKDSFGQDNGHQLVAPQEEHRVVAPPPPKKKKAVTPVVPPQEQAQSEPMKQVQTVTQVFQNIGHSQPSQDQEDDLNQISVPQPPKQPSRAVAPPPRPKKKSPKQPKRAPVQQYQDQSDEQHQQNSQMLMNYFSNQQQPVQNPRKISQIKQHHQQPETMPDVINPHSHEYRQQPQEEEDLPQNQQDSHYERQEFNVGKHFATEKKVVAQQEDNFLSHFSNNQPQQQEEQSHAVARVPPPKKKATKTKVQKAESYQTENAFEAQAAPAFNSNDFFNQLGSEPSPNLDIEESSIDHIDRDSSVLSNQQPYFTEQTYAQAEQPQVRPKPMKMTKKKAKRDQIKVVDPSLFA